MTIHRIRLKTHLLLTTRVRSVHSGHSREKFQKAGPSASFVFSQTKTRPALRQCRARERDASALGSNAELDSRRGGLRSPWTLRGGARKNKRQAPQPAARSGSARPSVHPSRRFPGRYLLTPKTANQTYHGPSTKSVRVWSIPITPPTRYPSPVAPID
jgi:hypothetical protein